MNNMDMSEVQVAQIRALQAIYSTEHQALLNWGKWSRDRRKVFPPGTTPNPIWDNFVASKVEDWGDDHAISETRLAHADAKPEPHEVEEYDEKAGTALDERIHGYGGLGAAVRLAIRVAYVSRYLPEEQFHRAAGCPQDAFRERLEEALRFVRRFVV